MNEARGTTLLSHWVSANCDQLPSFIFEAKVCNLTKKKSIGLYCFEDHQLPTLRKAVGRGLWYKHPDLGHRTPGDGMFFKGEAYVALYWYMPRVLKHCHLIRIQDFDKFFEGADKRSIRQEEAEEIATYSFDL